MITATVHDAIFLSLKLGWDYDWDDLHKDLERFYNTQNITLSATIGQDDCLDLHFPTDNDETMFRLKYSEYL